MTLQRALATGYFRPYTNADVIGAEVGGACKNVIALACGMAAGVGLGENTAAAIITRGLAEIMRLGIALGAKAATLAGLAGVGDLVATCTSPQSRNRAFGERLGRGETLEAAQRAAGGHVAEGVTSCESVLALAASYDVEMPLTDAVHRVCHQGICRSTRRSRCCSAAAPNRSRRHGRTRTATPLAASKPLSSEAIPGQPVAPPPVPASAYHLSPERERLTRQLRPQFQSDVAATGIGAGRSWKAPPRR